MTSESKQQKKKDKKKDKRTLLLILLLLLLLLLLTGLLLYFLLTRDKGVQPLESTEIEPEPKAVVVPVKKDTVVEVVKKVPVIPRDTVPVEPDTVDTVPPDTVVYDPCKEDTIAPWVYPDPYGGLHYKKVVVRLVASEPCRVEWQFKNDTRWLVYSPGDSISIKKTATISYRAQDTCNNSMEVRHEKYEIKLPKKKYCPEGMEYIKIGSVKFCIDQYEWPNKKKVKPLSYISVYHAIDSCFTVGKRLCTSDEWSIACGGAYSWKYPYGDRYEPKACVTRDKAVSVSGSKPECRGYFGIFDMAGNLAEWTNTRSKKNKEFYNVMGGFWESGPRGSCFEPRYSYYPQNRHNPVGFRCCKDVNKQ